MKSNILMLVPDPDEHRVDRDVGRLEVSRFSRSSIMQRDPHVGGKPASFERLADATADDEGHLRQRRRHRVR